MKAYNYCTIGNSQSTTTCVFSGIGAFSSETVARNYLIDNFFEANGVYPQRVEITPVSRSMVQELLNDSEE